MYLQCPVCCYSGSEDEIRFIGDHKVICGHCRSILEISFICPECGQVIRNWKGTIEQLSLREKLFYFFRNGFWPNWTESRTCRICHYKGHPGEFEPILR
jgi:hypothetical protein